MSEPPLSFVAFLKAGITNPTLINDFLPLQSREFRNALNTYHGTLGEEDAAAETVRDYHLLQDLQALLAGIGGGGLNALSRILNRHIPKAKRAAGWHDQNYKPPPVIQWGPLTYAGVAFQIYLAVKGPDRAFALATAPAIMRAFGIYYDRGTQPTANWKGIYEMNEQRLIRSVPALCLYAATTAPAHRDFYGSKLYYGLNIALSAPVLGAIVVRREWDSMRDRRDIKRTIKALKVMEDDGEVDVAQIAQDLETTAQSIETWRKLTRALRNLFKISYAAGDAYNELMTEVTKILKAIRSTARREIFRGDNPEAEEKWGAFVLADILVGLSIASTKGNPINLVLNALWGSWFLQRMWQSARNEDHKAEDTLKLLSQAGISLIFTFFTVYLPLLAFGPDVFEKHDWLFYTSLSLQLALNGFYGHLVGKNIVIPALLPTMRFTGRFVIKPAGKYVVKPAGKYVVQPIARGGDKVWRFVACRPAPASVEEVTEDVVADVAAQEGPTGDVALEDVITENNEEEASEEILTPAEEQQADELAAVLREQPDSAHLRGGGDETALEDLTVEDLVKDLFDWDTGVSSWKDPVDEEDLGLLDTDSDEEDDDEEEGLNPLDRAFQSLGQRSVVEDDDAEEKPMAKFVDLMSVLDIAEDTKHLPNDEGEDEFARIRSFLLTMFSDKKGKGLLRTIGFLFA